VRAAAAASLREALTPSPPLFLFAVVRTDGPPFYDIKAKPGKGFDQDYERLAKYLGPGKVGCRALTAVLAATTDAHRPAQISLADFMRDIEAINKSYVPTALASYKWLQYGTIG
jgi:hypothetical protein